MGGMFYGGVIWGGGSWLGTFSSLVFRNNLVEGSWGSALVIYAPDGATNGPIIVDHNTFANTGPFWFPSIGGSSQKM